LFCSSLEILAADKTEFGGLKGGWEEIKLDWKARKGSRITE